MEYTIRFAFKRDGEVSPPRMTYATRDAQAALRDIYREAIDASAARRCISAPGWPERSLAIGSPSASSTSARPIRTAGNNPPARLIAVNSASFSAHSRVSGNPVFLIRKSWVPAFAGASGS